MEQCDLLLGGSYLITMDHCDTRVKDGAVAVKDGKIAAIDTLTNLRARYAAKQEIVHENAVLLPGLINAHCHETLTRGLHEDLPLMRWLVEVCYPIEGSYTPEDMYAAALMTQLELIRGGVTTFIDIFRFADQGIKALKQSGLRCFFTPQFFDATCDHLESIDRTVQLIEQHHGTENGRVNVWFGPHAPYSCGPESYARAAKLADELGVGIHTHLCETRDEVRIIKELYGKDPVQYLNDAGVFDVPNIMAHSIYLTDENIAFLAKKRETTGLAYCPISNMKVADGVARVPDLLAAGCTLGLGTDSNLSNNGLDMFNEMRIGSCLQKVFRDDATIMPCFEMLRLATNGSAAVFKLQDKIGSLEIGKCADVIAVSFDEPHMWPVYYEKPSNIVEQLVYSARGADVITTVVDGRVLMDDRKVLTINQKDTFTYVQERAADLYARSFPNP